ncbi:hypothetical protein [Sorangium cellulosum]|uniref:hypothetical protein n=1 Tax=Sorangium cellulosum TaxID=56 RepID=UPI0004104C23|nr:hypothetical protein [Sorangium cellulosum]
MFTAIASSQQPIELRRLEGAIFAVTGPHVARAHGGRLHDPRRTEVVVAPSADGVSPPPVVPQEIKDMAGRWPDRVWALATNVGWQAHAAAGPSPAMPGIITAASPRNAVVRWDEERGRWVEQPDLAWIRRWADGVLAMGVDGALRWLDGSDRPIPPVLAEKLLWDGWNPPFGLGTTKSGDVIVFVTQSTRLEPGWWVFPRGELTPERLVLPPGVDEKSVAVHTGGGGDELLARGSLRSGERFIARRAQGTWQMLPPFRGDYGVPYLLATPSGGLFVCSSDHTSPLCIYRLGRGGSWEPIPIPFHTDPSKFSSSCLVAGEEGDLWLTVDFGDRYRHQVVLYHARG